MLNPNSISHPIGEINTTIVAQDDPDAATIDISISITGVETEVRAHVPKHLLDDRGTTQAIQTLEDSVQEIKDAAIRGTNRKFREQENSASQEGNC